MLGSLGQSRARLPRFGSVRFGGIFPRTLNRTDGLIALALRANVNPWWTKITRYDKQLLVEFTRILLAQHCADYRIAARKLGSSYAAAGSASLPMLFHGQQQHVGVSPDGKIDQVYVRAAVDVVLKACLSPEDWDAEAERYLIREIIVKTVWRRASLNHGFCAAPCWTSLAPQMTS